MTSILAGLFMIAFLVVIHEAGHFVVARIFGVGAPVFSIGFGPRVFGVRLWGTDFRVSAVPFGGYVMLAGADPFGEEDVSQAVPEAESFMKRPVWQRLLIMAAGPGVNLALPFVLFTILLMLGRPDWGTTIGAVLPGSVAAQAGLRSGDVVLALGGEEAVVWKDVEHAARARMGTVGEVELRVQRGAEVLTVALPSGQLVADHEGSPDLLGLGIQVYALSTRIGVDQPGSPGGVAGLRTGDRVLKVDGREVKSWEAMLAALSGDRHEVAYERVDEAGGTETVQATAVLTRADWQATAADPFANPWGLVPVTVFASRVEPEGPAARAGLRAGDRLLQVNGEPILTFHSFIGQVARSLPMGASQPKALDLTVVRGGEQVSLSMTPEVRVMQGEAYSRPIIGIGSFRGTGISPSTTRKYYGLVEAVPVAVHESVDIIRRTTAVLANLFTGRSDPRDNVGGPVAIFVTAGEVAELGFFPYATVIGMISVSLGLINLLPVPVLDGGQIVFYLVEALRGRPLSLELRERVQMVGVVALAVLFVLVTINDLTRWISP